MSNVFPCQLSLEHATTYVHIWQANAELPTLRMDLSPGRQTTGPWADPTTAYWAAAAYAAWLPE